MKTLTLSLTLITTCLLAVSSTAQTNLVANPGFEDIIDCNIDWGEIDKATPWRITGSINSSPDVYHECASEDSFYGIPPNVPTYDGDGMAGIVSLFAEEKIYSLLLAPLPTDHDIYLSFAIQPEEITDPEFGKLCYSNTHSMAFSDNLVEFPSLALSSDTLINNFNNWTKLETCYRATGEEKYVFLGNYQNSLNQIIYCDNLDETNFTYSYLDEVIVAPFDVVPDTVIICAGETHEFAIKFFDLPISWNDGFVGGTRTMAESGIFSVRAQTANCQLQDNTVVIKIPEREEVIEMSICDEATSVLTTPVPAIWEDGTIGTSIAVSRPGRYTAELLIDCEEESVGYLFEVTEIYCGIEAFVPNVFSPNADGLNDDLIFYFNSMVDFSGELIIFDRWGNHLFKKIHNSASPTLSWDGTYKGDILNTGVYIWVFRYQSMGDIKTRVLSGDVTIVK